MRRGWLLAPALLLALAGCGVPPSESVSCTGLDPVDTWPRDDARAAAVSGQEAERAAAAGVSRVFSAPAIADRSRRGQPVVYLALSTGGQWGAYGSGFLAGWSANPASPRPAFQIVTGGSAGATIAPFAFAGSSFDAALPFGPDAEVERYARMRNPLALPVSNSVFDARVLAEEMAARNTPALREALAQGANENRALLTGAVNLTTGSMEVFDLAGYAARDDAKPECLTQAVLASAAIPVILPPRRINDAPYADAGLRDHVFFRGIEAERARSGSGQPIEAYLIINGDLHVPAASIDSEDLVTLSLRAFSIVNDQGLRQSLREALDLAEESGWTVRATYARGVDLSRCEAERARQRRDRALFQSCVTRLLYDKGYQDGRRMAPDDWIGPAEMRAILARN